MKRYPATFSILATCIAIEIACQVQPELRDFLAFTPGTLRGAFGIISYQLTHAGWGHLLGNMTFGLPFMLFLEQKLGRSRFVQFYFGCGVASALLQFMLGGNPNMEMIGASGSIFGVMVGACMAFGETMSEHILALAYLTILVVPQIAMGPMGAILGIAIYGHVGGALGGLLLSHRIHNHTQERK